jgi:hypothetical protein
MSTPVTPDRALAERECPGAPARLPRPTPTVYVNTVTPLALDFDQLPVSRCVTPTRVVDRLPPPPNAPMRPIAPAAIAERVDLSVPVPISPPRILREQEMQAPGAPMRQRQNTDLEEADVAPVPHLNRGSLERQVAAPNNGVG